MKSIHLSAYKDFQKRLVEARDAADLTQKELAEKLGRPQSFVSKVEAGDRRLDVVEYVQWMLALEEDPGKVIGSLVADMKRRRRVSLE